MSELLSFLQSYGGALALLGSVATIVLASKFVTRESLTAQLSERDGRIGGVSDRVDLIEDRLIKIQNDIEHLPDRDASHRMELAVSGLQGQVEVLAERIKPVAHISDRLQEYLLDQARAR